MSNIQTEAEHWRQKLTEDIDAIYDLKDHALKSAWGGDAHWHAELSRVAADLRLLSAWLGHITAREKRFVSGFPFLD